MIVMKFGGTSVGTGERMANVARIAVRTARETGTPPVVVVSAMSGVTDSLRHAAQTAAAGDARTFGLIRDELQQRHEQAIDDCVIDVEHARGLRAEVGCPAPGFREPLQQHSHPGRADGPWAGRRISAGRAALGPRRGSGTAQPGPMPLRPSRPPS
jgi:hypothetical protein